jgi:predicted DNA-binding WGR domain protein
MAVVSSIDSSEITNDYNDGARCLKNYLRYAQAVSVGDLGAAGRILHEITVRPQEAGMQPEPDPDVAVQQITDDLRRRGYVVESNVGQSNFRCDLAVRCAGDQAHRVGILVDTDRYYRQTDIVERDVMRPQLLETLGWRVEHVLAKDWHHDQFGTLKRIINVIEGTADNARASSDLSSVDKASKPETLDTPELQPITKTASLKVEGNALGTAVGGPALTTRTQSRTVHQEPESTRYFEFHGGVSHKFWEIAVSGPEHTVRFGRIGTSGQKKTKSFSDADAAQRDAQRLINEKLAKGYRESG